MLKHLLFLGFGFGFLSHAANLDRFGGTTNLPCQRGPAAKFYTEKINNRWWFCTPAGNAMWVQGVYNIAHDAGVHPLINKSHKNIVLAKYGDTNKNWAAQQLRRIRSWGFNTAAEYANGYALPTFYRDHPVPTPFIALLRPSYYALTNQKNHAPGPVKELLQATRADVFNGWRQWHTPDTWDPNYKIWTKGALTRDSNPSSWFHAQGSEYLIGVVIDDTDWLIGFGAGGDFNTVTYGKPNTSGGRNQPHLGWLALVTPPEQSGSAALPGYPNGMVYQDPVVYTKQELAKFLEARHTTIGQLNLAWGSAYSSFGSTAAAHTGEPLGKGDGKTRTFTAKLRRIPLTKFTLRILINNVPVAGDFGSGTLRGSAVTAASTINYATGDLKVIFATAPPAGASLTMNYKTGGWGSGTGLLDEDGTSPWVSKDWRRLSGAKSAFRADLNGFLFAHARQYFRDMRYAVKAVSPATLYLGPTYLGSWCAPARSEVLRAAKGLVDAYAAPGIPCGVPDDQARIDYIYANFGDKPWLEWEALLAQPDSLMSYVRPGDTMRPQFLTQEERGDELIRIVRGLQNARATNGPYLVAGYRFWALMDGRLDKMNLGLVNHNDDPYDGISSRRAKGTDLWGYPTGGTPADYGDFISRVKTANGLWLQLARPRSTGIIGGVGGLP
jgi:hypothetical protein